MSLKNLKLIIALSVLALISTACSISTSTAKPSLPGNTVDSSVFLSTDGGKSWQAKVDVPTADSRPQTIGSLNVNTLVMDPADSLAIYLASFEKGLYYTYNITAGWNKVASLPTATVSDVKVDPKNKCIIYAAIANRLYRSVDCTRNWVQVYFDNNTGVGVTTVAIDHYNPRNLYIGTSRGEIIKSIDSGESWRTIQRLDDGLARLIVSPLDSRLLFVATVKNQIFSFRSSTVTNAANSADVDENFLVEDWTDLNEVLRDYTLGNNFKDIIATKDGLVFLATDKLILRSSDDGLTWENIKLLQPEKDAVINALAINPQATTDISYVTNTTFFHSLDGGATWSTKSLPTKRAGRNLLIDFKNPNNIYLSTVQLKQ
ncbi:MAG: hypothetical protein WC863_01365 [Patescibacteria group bacterium]